MVDGLRLTPGHGLGLDVHPHQLREADDGVQGRAQLMRQTGQEIRPRRVRVHQTANAVRDGLSGLGQIAGVGLGPFREPGVERDKSSRLRPRLQRQPHPRPGARGGQGQQHQNEFHRTSSLPEG